MDFQICAKQSKPKPGGWHSDLHQPDTFSAFTCMKIAYTCSCDIRHSICWIQVHDVINDILYDTCLQREVCWIIANVYQEGTHVSKRKTFRKVTHPSRTYSSSAYFPSFKIDTSNYHLRPFSPCSKASWRKPLSQKSTQTHPKRQLRGCSAQAHLMNSRIQNSFLSFPEITSERLPKVFFSMHCVNFVCQKLFNTWLK